MEPQRRMSGGLQDRTLDKIPFGQRARDRLRHAQQTSCPLGRGPALGLIAWAIVGGRCRLGVRFVEEAAGFVSDIAGGSDMLDKGEILAGGETIQRALGDLLRKA